MGQTHSREAELVESRRRSTQYKWIFQYALGLRAAEARVHEQHPVSNTHDTNTEHASDAQSTNGLQASNDDSNTLTESRGNIGSPKRQQKYRRGKCKEDHAKSSGHQPDRKNDDEHAIDGAKDQTKKSQRLETESRHATPERTKECSVCTETRPLSQFPERPPTERCEHDIDTCYYCLRTWINCEFTTKMWNEIDCPSCRARLQYDDVKDFALRDVFLR